MARRTHRHSHEEEHENHERWLVSYADFITLLFAFFVVMYALSSVNEGKYRVLSDSLVNAFRSQSNVSGATIVSSPNNTTMPAIIPRPAKVDAAQARRKAEHTAKMRNMADEIKRVLDPLVKDGQVRVTEGIHGISVEIDASVLFAPGGAALGSDAERALGAVARVVAGADFPITIEGHTDNIPINTVSFPSNWELSAVRASSVVRLFVGGGVAAARLTAAGYGDQRPLDNNDTADGRARNRRVTILIESMVPEVAPEAAPTVPVRGPVDGALGTPENARLVVPSASESLAP